MTRTQIEALTRAELVELALASVRVNQRAWQHLKVTNGEGRPDIRRHAGNPGGAMTAVETETSVESIEALDFDAERVCELVDCPALPRPRAAWWGIPSCGCGNVKAACTGCKEYLANPADPSLIECLGCHGIVTVRFEPIK